jgi:uncharacterized protein YndB with AHSA1/START domain
MAAEGQKRIRRLKKEVEVAASPAAVWKALTDGEELARWFPLSARVKPGKDGSVFLSWGPGWEGEARIDAWEPVHLFRWVESKGPVAEGVTTEWKLEPSMAGGRKTLLRLVQSGFSTGADWEEEYYGSTEYGWGFMLANLRHYLERHAGTPRRVAWPKFKVALSREDAYEKLAAPGGLFREGAGGLKAGSEYMLEAATGESFEGRVEFVRAPRGFCVCVRSLNDALFWLTIEGAGGAGGMQHDVQIWLSTYGLPQAKVDDFTKTWEGVLQQILE